MAKYGYKEGQGLGKKEQGMSMALQVSNAVQIFVNYKVLFNFNSGVHVDGQDRIRTE